MRIVLAAFSIMILAVLSYVGYAYYRSIRQPSPTTAATELPKNFSNPFDEQKPATSFDAMTATTPAPVNPFAEPTQGYQNPFSTTPTDSNAYQNPFEALR